MLSGVACAYTAAPVVTHLLLPAMSLLARLPWPLPALLAWALAWLVFVALQPVASPVWAVSAACALAALASLWGGNWWRRGLIAAGFPLALALTGWVSLPAWAWLVPLLLLLAVYPLNAWRDAPLFPTPHAALQGLSAQVPLAPGARVLDAGCGLGDGLMALRAFPLLSRLAARCGEGGRHQRGGAALARWPLAWAVPTLGPWAVRGSALDR